MRLRSTGAGGSLPEGTAYGAIEPSRVTSPSAYCWTLSGHYTVAKPLSRREADTRVWRSGRRGDHAMRRPRPCRILGLSGWASFRQCRVLHNTGLRWKLGAEPSSNRPRVRIVLVPPGVRPGG